MFSPKTFLVLPPQTLICNDSLLFYICISALALAKGYLTQQLLSCNSDSPYVSRKLDSTSPLKSLQTDIWDALCVFPTRKKHCDTYQKCAPKKSYGYSKEGCSVVVDQRDWHLKTLSMNYTDGKECQDFWRGGEKQRQRFVKVIGVLALCGWERQAVGAKAVNVI